MSAAAPAPRRVALCDDAIGFPELVVSWITAAEDLELDARTSTLTELHAHLDAGGRPDVLLLDFMLPEGPTDAARVDDLRARVPGLRVVLVSSLPAVALREEALRTGADGFCTKATTAPELLAVVRG